MQVADLRADVSESWHGTTSTEELLIYLLLHVYCCSAPRLTVADYCETNAIRAVF